MKHLFILALAASLMTTGCGGGGDAASGLGAAFGAVGATGSTGTSTPGSGYTGSSGSSGGTEGCSADCLSPDQMAFESVVVQNQGGGGFALTAQLPTSGLPSSDFAYYLLGREYSISASLASVSPQILPSEHYTPASINLPRMPFESTPYTYLRDGKLWGYNYQSNPKSLQYLGTGVQTASLSVDGATVLWSAAYSNVKVHDLVGSVRATFDGITYPFVIGEFAPLGSNAALMRPGATWMPGSKVMSFNTTATSDRVAVLNCSQTLVPYPSTPIPCANGTTLSEWVASTAGADWVGKIFTTHGGVKMWAKVENPDSAGVRFFEWNGGIYAGRYIPAGHAYIEATGGTTTNWMLNKAGWESLKAALAF